MHRFEICIFYLAEAAVEILLGAAASIPAEDAGTFADGLGIRLSISVFSDLHQIILSFFLIVLKMRDFYTAFGEICFVYFPLRKEKVIGNL